MALKPTLANKAELDALPEAVRTLYTEKDNKFLLDLEGGYASPTEVHELKTKVAEFRDTNVNLLKKVGDLEPALKKFDGIDPEEYKKLKEKADKLAKKGVKEEDDIEAMIARAVETATKPLVEKVAAEETARKAAQASADQARFRELMTAEAKKKGVRDNSVRHVLREAEEKYELRDGRILPKNGIKNPHDPLRPYEPADWLDDLAKSDDNLFEVSGGGGAEGSGNKPRPGVKVLLNPTPLQMGQHAKEIAKGEMIVQRS